MSCAVFCSLAKVIPCILLNQFYSNTDSSVETTCYVSVCCYTHIGFKFVCTIICCNASYVMLFQVYYVCETVIGYNIC